MEKHWSSEGEGQLLVSLFKSSMPLAPIPVEASGSMTRELTSAAHSTRRSFFPLAMSLLPPKLHPHPKQESCNQADAYGDQYLWLQSEPRSLKQGAEDGYTNGDPHGSHIGPYDKEDDSPYPTCHEERVSESKEGQQGGPVICPVRGGLLPPQRPQADPAPAL